MRGKPAFAAFVTLLTLSGCGGGGGNGPDPVPIPTPAPQAVKACIAPLANSGIVILGQSVTLDGTCSSPAASASGVTYTWDPGDGRAVKTGGSTMTDTYPASGKYSASLTVTQGSASDKVLATVRIHIDCQQPASNGPNVISVDQNRLCMISGDGGATLQVTSNGSVLFKGSDFSLQGDGFEVRSNECLDKALSGSTLFPGEKCDIKIAATCTKGTTGRFSIGGPGGTVPSRYNVNLTCNP